MLTLCQKLNIFFIKSSSVLLQHPPPFDPIEKALIGHSSSVQHQCQQGKTHVIASSRQRSKFLGFTKSAFFPGGGGRVGAFLQFHRDATFTAGWVPSGDRFATN